MNSPEFLHYWLTFSALILVLIGVVLFLAHRAGYFKDQDRARSLALWAEVPEEKEKPVNGPRMNEGETGLDRKQ